VIGERSHVTVSLHALFQRARRVQVYAPVKALDLLMRFKTVRQRTLSVCAPLSVEDMLLQSMPDASPVKWHLAHTTWFFEAMVLGDQQHNALWNSYYEALGPRVDRAHRGLMSRPSLDEVHVYRAAIDERVCAALQSNTLAPETHSIVELGLHHEQQHQELILTDIKHALATQLQRPPYRTDLERSAHGAITPLAWIEHDGGIAEIGAGERSFSFDNERPRHRTVIEPFALASRPVCNAEVLAFIGDGGYADPRLWLSDGFAVAQREGWRAPLYWELVDGVWLHYDMTGLVEPDPAATACHLSYYEADAIARWANARLPTEAEWEVAAEGRRPREGHWADDDRLHPTAASGDGIAQLFGDVWEWTQSPYVAYPGFRPLGGALGEYNGKFMSGQMVLRGGSCFTPRGHVRASYRNFFPPHARWQMAGVRFANDRGAR
jgi:ergothioneine biosynthesis protein EgtB